MNVTDKALQQSLSKQVAAIMLAGGNIHNASQTLGVSRRKIQNIILTDEYKAIVNQAGDEALGTAKTFLRREVSKLAHKMIEVINSKLDEGSLEAVKIGLKVMGFDNEERVEGDTNIQVVLPTGAEKAIEVEYGQSNQEDGGQGIRTSNSEYE